MRKDNLANSRIGMINKNKYGSIMEVIEYSNTNDIVVKFTNYDKPISNKWGNFVRGDVRSPYDLSIYGIGYLGEGKYKAYINNKATIQYSKWFNMMSRCYDEKSHARYPNYKECSVDVQWHNFQSFAKWFDENYYEVEGEKMCLDKDILTKGNKIYSPETCIFVPERINILFINRNMHRGDFPIGVSYDKTSNKYSAQCSIGNGKRKHLSNHNTPEEAFYSYKKFKEQLIKQIAEEYKKRIPLNLYNAMINYIVEIND